MSPLWILCNLYNFNKPLQTLTSSFHQLPWVCNHGDSCFTQLPNLATDDANSVSQSHSCLAWQKQGTFAGKPCSLLDVMRECMEYVGYMGCFQACVKGRLASNVFCAAAFSAHILRVPKLCQGKPIAVRATHILVLMNPQWIKAYLDAVFASFRHSFLQFLDLALQIFDFFQQSLDHLHGMLLSTTRLCLGFCFRILRFAPCFTLGLGGWLLS